MPGSSRMLALLALALTLLPAHDLAATEPEPKVTVAAGLKAGFIPPVLAAPELVVHFPHLMLGVFGIYTPDGIGSGGTRSTLGGEIALEVSRPGESTFYVSGAFFHYDAAPDASGRHFERTDALPLTAGYEWKARHLELQLGAGALLMLRDETPPCTGLACVKPYELVLPMLDLSLRYRF